MASCEGCGASPADLQCPKCKELKLTPSLFCTQACFKSSWAKHKEKHAQLAGCSIKTMRDMDLKTFKFTGQLRPGLISPPRSVPEEIPRPDYALTPDGTSIPEQRAYASNRPVKWDGTKLQGIREACRITREVLDVAIATARPGVTTDEIDRAVHEAFVHRGAYPSTLGYLKFPKSCCTSINEVICHGIPDSTVLQEGDIVNLDISGYFGGFHGDCNETIFIGKPDPESLRLVHTTYLATLAGIALVKPGVLYKHVGDVISALAESQGFGVVRNITGHGIGELFHCPPTVAHYANNKSVGQMAIGHVFTIEPMINAGSWKDVCWPDDWTVTTADGKRSVQFEHTMVVTKDGCEVLTKSTVWDRPYYQIQAEEFAMPLPDVGANSERLSNTEFTGDAKSGSATSE